MITWASIILIALKVVNAIMNAVSQDKLLQAGADSEIAKMAMSILGKTTAGKAIMEKVNALSDPEVDAALRGLEPE